MLQFIGDQTQQLTNSEYIPDLAIVACGYESRCTHIASQFHHDATLKIAIAFGVEHEPAAVRSREVLERLGYQCISVADDHIASTIAGLLQRISTPRANVLVDISSFSRVRIAGILEALSTHANTVAVCFGYSVAKFTPPNHGSTPPISLTPLSPMFAGWFSEPERPVAMVLGLGYEEGRGVGAVEYLEPSSTWAFVPHSADTRFDRAMANSNRLLLDQLGRTRIVSYELNDPNQLLAMLLPLVKRLESEANVVLLPDGPKLFVLMSLLVALVRPNVSVWKATASAPDTPIDRQPSGKVVFFGVQFSPALEEQHSREVEPI